MIRVFVYVEGYTEHFFVRDVLVPYLVSSLGEENRWRFDLIPIIAHTSREKSGRKFKGGITSYKRQVKPQIRDLLTQNPQSWLTTMLDYYRLPKDFPGKATLPAGTPYQRVTHLEREFANDINSPRFFPFIVLHEFEALLLAQPSIIGLVFPQYRQETQKLIAEIGATPPEEINEGEETHPAARIQYHIPDYRKWRDGPRIAKQIGLNTIRTRCPHFNEWLRWLETLAQKAKQGDP